MDNAFKSILIIGVLKLCDCIERVHAPYYLRTTNFRFISYIQLVLKSVTIVFEPNRYWQNSIMYTILTFDNRSNLALELNPQR